jgi:hypothetical protein
MLKSIVLIRHSRHISGVRANSQVHPTSGIQLRQSSTPDQGKARDENHTQRCAVTGKRIFLAAYQGDLQLDVACTNGHFNSLTTFSVSQQKVGGRFRLLASKTDLLLIQAGSVSCTGR